MFWELGFLTVFAGGMWSSWRGGRKQGYRRGMKMGVNHCLHNLEMGEILKVNEQRDGSTVIKALTQNEMHIDPFGRTHVVKLVEHDK